MTRPVEPAGPVKRLHRPSLQPAATGRRRRHRRTDERERAFVRHFLAGPPGVRFNATASALAAGYAVTRQTARSYGPNILGRPSVQRLLDGYRRRAELTVERTLEEWRRLAFADLRDFAAWDDVSGLRLKPSDALEDDTAPALSEVVEHKTTRTSTRRTAAMGKPGEPGYVPPGEVTTETVERNLRVKLHSKVEALVNISKYLGILADHAPPPPPTGLPRGFFAAVILRDPSKLQGVAPELLELPSETAPAEPAVIDGQGEVSE